MATKLSSIVQPGAPMAAGAAPAAAQPLVRQNMAGSMPANQAAPSPSQSALSAFYGSSPSAPAASAPTAQPMATMPTIHPNTNYDQAFQNALAQSRSSIAAQVRNALTESNAETTAGNQQLGTLVPTVGAVTAAGQHSLAGVAAGSDQVERDNGFRSFQSGAQQVAPSMDAMSQLKGFTQGAVPLIQSGIADRAAQRQASIQQYQAQMNEQLQQQEAQYAEQKSLAQMQIDAQTKQQQNNLALQHGWSVEDATRAHNWQVGDATTAADRQAALYKTLYGPSSQQSPIPGMMNDQYQSITSSKPFENVMSGLANGTMRPEDVYHIFSSNPQWLSVIADNNPTIAGMVAGKIPVPAPDGLLAPRK